MPTMRTLRLKSDNWLGDGGRVDRRMATKAGAPRTVLGRYRLARTALLVGDRHLPVCVLSVRTPEWRRDNFGPRFNAGG